MESVHSFLKYYIIEEIVINIIFMRVHSIVVVCCMLGVMGVPAVVSAATPDCALLTRNLRVGMTGEDVRVIQTLLNAATSTRVATDGPGAPGSETTYFGNKTKAALAVFQEQFTAEVLAPAGLSRGSGFFGNLTRGKLVSLCNVTKQTPVEFSKAAPVTTQPVVPPTSAASTTTTATTSNTTGVTVPALLPGQTTPTTTPSVLSPALGGGFKSDTPVLTYPSTYVGQRGSTVTLSGIGFPATGNVVHLDDVAIASTTLLSGGRILFVVPSTVSIGNHSLWVSAPNGVTRKTYFVVTDSSTTPPVITSISPDKGSKGTMVTVKGSGFLHHGNTVRTSYGVVSDLTSSDGTTLQFSISPAIPPMKQTADLPIWLNVVNNNGVSGFVVFHLSL